MNVLEKAFDLGVNKYLKGQYKMINTPDFPFFAVKKSTVRFRPPQQPDRQLLSRKRCISVELKSNKGSSIALSRIKEHQLEELRSFKEFVGESYLIISFNEMSEIYLLSIGQYDLLVKSVEKKSLNVKDIRAVGIKMECEKLKVNYRLNLSLFDKKTELLT